MHAVHAVEARPTAAAALCSMQACMQLTPLGIACNFTSGRRTEPLCDAPCAQRSPAGKRGTDAMGVCQRVNFSEKELPVFDDPVVGFSPPHALHWLESVGVECPDPDTLCAVLATSLGRTPGGAVVRVPSPLLCQPCPHACCMLPARLEHWDVPGTRQ